MGIPGAAAHLVHDVKDFRCCLTVSGKANACHGVRHMHWCGRPNADGNLARAASSAKCDASARSRFQQKNFLLKGLLFDTESAPGSLCRGYRRICVSLVAPVNRRGSLVADGIFAFELDQIEAAVVFVIARS